MVSIPIPFEAQFSSLWLLSLSPSRFSSTALTGIGLVPLGMTLLAGIDNLHCCYWAADGDITTKGFVAGAVCCKLGGNKLQCIRKDAASKT